MKKATILLIVLLLLSTFAVAEEQTQQTEKGFFAKIAAWFKGERAQTAQETGQDGQQTAGQSGQVGPAQTSVARQESGEKNTEEQAPQSIISTVATPAAQIAVQACYARDCEVTICMNEYQQEFFCPADYKECYKTYEGRCRLISCQPPAIIPPTCTCPACETTTGCDATVNTCYQVYTDNTGSQSKKPITCQGTYDSCVKRYDICECGMTTTTTSCDEKVNLCKKKVVSATNAAVTYTEVRCEDSYDNCVRVYGTCECGAPQEPEQPSCYEKINSCKTDNGIIDCYDTFETCEAQYGNCMCGKYQQPEETTCTEMQHTCKTMGQTVTAVTTQLVTCKGTFEDCQARYNDNCMCGLSEDTTTTTQTTQEEYCCCKAAVTGNQIIYQKTPVNSCAACLDDKYCATTQTTVTTTTQIKPIAVIR